MLRRLLVPLSALVVFCVLAGLHGIVWAQDAASAAEPNAVTRVTGIAFEILTVVATCFAIWAANRIIKAIENKTSVDVPERQEAQLRAWIREGAHYAAEQGYKRLKTKTGKLTGPELLEQGADYVLDTARANGWISLSKDYVKKRLEGYLGEKRANGGVPKPERMLEGQ